MFGVASRDTMAEGRENTEEEFNPPLFSETIPNFDHKCGIGDGVIAHNRILGLMRFMQEDVDNVVFRRFESLHILHILALQHQLKHCLDDVETYQYERSGYGPLLEILMKLGPLLKRYGKLPIRPPRLTSWTMTHATSFWKFC